MDVLQLLKTEFKERLAELTSLVEGSPASLGLKATLAHLQAHMSLETGYLLPEFAALSSKNDAVLARIEAEVKEIQYKIEQLAGYDVSVADLQDVKASFLAHSQTIEDRVLPIMRQKITTAEREELFFVLQDAKQDLFNSASIGHVV